MNAAFREVGKKIIFGGEIIWFDSNGTKWLPLNKIVIKINLHHGYVLESKKDKIEGVHSN